MRKLLGLTAVVLAIGAPAFAGDSGNFELFKQVEKQVLAYPFTSVFDSVHGRIDNGVVELTGKVTMPFKRTGIADRVARVPGVVAVRNKIEVLPVSSFDNELRLRIARALYSNPNFVGYGSRVNPPIRVIVERGRVTLEGVVNNEADRRIAHAIASAFGSFAFTNALKTSAEAKLELERL
jgi:hyperosmotically inducible periplasmic protein